MFILSSNWVSFSGSSARITSQKPHPACLGTVLGKIRTRGVGVGVGVGLGLGLGFVFVFQKNEQVLK